MHNNIPGQGNSQRWWEGGWELSQCDSPVIMILLYLYFLYTRVLYANQIAWMKEIKLSLNLKYSPIVCYSPISFDSSLDCRELQVSGTRSLALYLRPGHVGIGNGNCGLRAWDECSTTRHTNVPYSAVVRWPPMFQSRVHKWDWPADPPPSSLIMRMIYATKILKAWYGGVWTPLWCTGGFSAWRSSCNQWIKQKKEKRDAALRIMRYHSHISKTSSPQPNLNWTLQNSFRGSEYILILYRWFMKFECRYSDTPGVCNYPTSRPCWTSREYLKGAPIPFRANASTRGKSYGFLFLLCIIDKLKSRIIHLQRPSFWEFHRTI